MDLGRPPIARFPHGDRLLSSEPVTRQDLAHAESKVTTVRPADLNSLKYMHQIVMTLHGPGLQAWVDLINLASSAQAT